MKLMSIEFRQCLGRQQRVLWNPELDKPQESYRSGRRLFAVHKNMHSSRYVGSEPLAKLYEERFAEVFGYRRQSQYLAKLRALIAEKEQKLAEVRSVRRVAAAPQHSQVPRDTVYTKRYPKVHLLNPITGLSRNLSLDSQSPPHHDRSRSVYW